MASIEDNYNNLEPLGFDSVNMVLKTYLSTDRFIVKSFHLRPASNSLLGFLGDHFKLSINYALNGNVSEVSLFVKSIPRDNKSKADFNNQYRMFEREATVYGKIFNQFQQEKDSTIWYPKCYLAMKNDLVFEDLHVKGFRMQEVRNTLDNEHTFLALTSMARLHAASIVLEEKYSHDKKPYRLHEEFKNEINEACFADNDWYKVGLDTTLLLAAHSNKYGKSTPHFNRVQADLVNVFKDALQQCSLSNSMRNVLCHQDLWNNNLMFRYDSIGSPVQCVFVDYQACRFAPPSADILTFIYLNISKDARDKYFEEYFDYYYKQLTLILQENNINIKDIFPWDEYRESCEECKKWGLVQSIVLYQFMFSDPNEMQKKINDSELFMKSVNEPREYLVSQLNNDHVFCDRVMSNIDDLIELHIIQDTSI